ncbi:MAG: hypothetical protein LBJ46_11790 [Planctomycetota bacterium]|jgi:hypothetical protein|nr:hypothetical protein [Planctomycetota bacterium]
MNPAILLYIDGYWRLVEDGHVRAVPEYPRLSSPTLVLTDFGNAVSGVTTIHGRKDYAEAMIGRHLRDDNVIENEEVKVLIHYGTSVPDGWEALYTAMPVSAWRRMQAWVLSQADHCLLIPQAALMHRLTRKNSDGVVSGVVFHGERRISVLARGQGGLCYFSVRIRGNTEEDLRASSVLLIDRVRQAQTLESSDQRLALRWYTFGKTSSSEEGVAKIFSAHPEDDTDDIDEVGTEAYLQEDGTYRYFPLDALKPQLSERIAVNAALAKVSYFAERNIGYFSLCGGVISVVCLITAIVFFFIGDSTRTKAAEVNEDARRIVEAARAQAVSTLPADFSDLRDFVDLFLDAKAEVDPGNLLRTLRFAAGSEIKLLRLYMQPRDHELVIEGWVDVAAGSGDRLLADFLAQLRRNGFEPEAVGASIALRAPPGTGFAYQLRRNDSSRGAGGSS